MRIAILEDDPDQLALLRRWITDDGHDVHAYVSGREAMKMAGRESFDLFMLDWQVPDVTGAEVLMWVRANVSKSVPVLFVTVRDSEQDIVFALEHGADDYMVKPVRRQELLARVHALLRRAYPSEEKKLLSFPPFEIDTQRNEVRKDGGKIDLTPKEFELTVTLFRNMGRLMSRGHLQETVWGRSGDLATRTVDTHVSQVRKKLDLRPEAFQFQSRAPFYWIILGFVAVSLLIVKRLDGSRFGAYLTAVRENEDAAQTAGIDVVRVKLWAMMLSAALTAAGGCFYTQYFLFLDAGIAYGTWISVEALLAPIIGGIGTVYGPLLGALVVRSLGEATKLVTGHAPGLDLVIYGCVLVLVVAFAPRGIAGIFVSVRRALRKAERANG